MQSAAFPSPASDLGDRDQMPALRALSSSEANEPALRAPRAPDHRRQRVWLYIPKTFLMQTSSPAFPSAPALAASNSASTSPSPAIELSAMSSGTHSLRPLSWRGWVTRPWLTLLSGVTCAPSTAALGAAAFISSLPAIPASPSQAPAAGAARPTRGTCGPRSPGSRSRRTRNGSSARMSRGTSAWDCPRSSRTFAAWATAQKQACSRRLKRVHPTYGAGSSFWPTPTATARCWNRADIELSSRGLRFRPAIDQVGKQVSLTRATQLWSLMFHLVRQLGRPEGPKQYPFTRPLHLTLQPGTRFLPGDLTSNPNFLDWMMGWPIGWSEPTRSVTGWSRWLLRMRGELSALPSPGDGGSLSP